MSIINPREVLPPQHTHIHTPIQVLLISQLQKQKRNLKNTQLTQKKARKEGEKKREKEQKDRKDKQKTKSKQDVYIKPSI